MRITFEKKKKAKCVVSVHLLQVTLMLRVCLHLVYKTIDCIDKKKTVQKTKTNMSRYREWDLSCKVYVGNLGSSASKHEIESAFSKYGPLRNVWVARNPPGFAFVEFEDPRDAKDAVRGLDGVRCCGTDITVEMSTGRSRRGGGGVGGGTRRLRQRYSRSRSRSPRRRSLSRSRSRDRRSRSDSRDRR